MKQFVKDNYKYIIFFLSFFFVNLLFLYRIHNNLNNDIFKLLFVILFIIGIIIFIINYKLKEKEIHNLFLVFSIIIGISYVIAIPIGVAPDEAAHFRRAYEISDLHIVSDRDKDGTGGRILPSTINDAFSFNVQEDKYSNLANIIFKSKNSQDKDFQRFGNTSLYSPICYMPQVIGILVGKIFHLPIILIIYLARIFNLACFIAITYFSIKHIPLGKLTLSLILLSPISMQAASSCQADALTNAVAIGLLSFVLHKIKDKKRLDKKEMIIASILAIVMSMCKIVYIPICLMLYLIPEKCFKNKKDKYIKITLLAIFTILINLIWLKISASYLVEFQEGVNSPEQIKYIIKAPLYYIAVLFNTYETNGMYYYLT